MNQSNIFIFQKDIESESVGEGITRQILGYDKSLMLVKVSFIKSSIGEIHSHPHVQSSYIESGTFEVSINEKKEILKTGDAFFVPSNIKHGVICLESGTIIDTFNPIRKDFL
ncbi:cupin domain-containing protein [Dysgonomonas sp. Marseille-P4677]|uniref:cupin domain-containing protein n=1 Tax=Dysgonomonas sp. Marseille-P4677 TaxID=2364790 RepID=UPI00191164F6|nr:cupin domain-containing protein [Dysgonomonas sp. Marseille-P4677]MBK5719413.1 cupin domain-containing protein [Dysgonomonas sp. Marseille-P4677]